MEKENDSSTVLLFEASAGVCAVIHQELSGIQPLKFTADSLKV